VSSQRQRADMTSGALPGLREPDIPRERSRKWYRSISAGRSPEYNVTRPRRSAHRTYLCRRARWVRPTRQHQHKRTSSSHARMGRCRWALV